MYRSPPISLIEFVIVFFSVILVLFFPYACVPFASRSFLVVSIMAAILVSRCCYPGDRIRCGNRGYSYEAVAYVWHHFPAQYNRNTNLVYRCHSFFTCAGFRRSTVVELCHTPQNNQQHIRNLKHNTADICILNPFLNARLERILYQFIQYFEYRQLLGQPSGEYHAGWPSIPWNRYQLSSKGFFIIFFFFFVSFPFPFLL